MSRLVKMILTETRIQTYLVEVPDDREDPEWLKRYFWDREVSSYVDPITDDTGDSTLELVGMDSDEVANLEAYVTAKVCHIHPDSVAETDAEMLRRRG